MLVRLHSAMETQRKRFLLSSVKESEGEGFPGGKFTYTGHQSEGTERQVESSVSGERAGFLSQLSFCCCEISVKSFSLPLRILSEFYFLLAMVLDGGRGDHV